MTSRVRVGEAGNSAIEFAMLAPVLLVMLFGIIAYGGYFWLSHSVQQLANDAARAAVGGLTTSERQSLAAASLTTEEVSYPGLTPALATLNVNDANQQITVAIAYDASMSPFWAMRGLVPMPSSLITRQATIRLGGY